MGYGNFLMEEYDNITAKRVIDLRIEEAYFKYGPLLPFL